MYNDLIKSTIFPFSIVIVAVVAAVWSVSSQEPSAYAECSWPKGELYTDRIIPACTRLLDDISTGKADPAKRIPALLVRGRAYHARDWGKAKADFDEVIRLDPGNAEAFKLRGRLWSKPDQAIADFNEAIRLNSNDSEAYFERGNSYWRKAELDHALGDYEEALRLDPTSTWAQSSVRTTLMLRIRKGLSDFNHSRDENLWAISEYSEVIRRFPNDAEAYKWRGLAYEAVDDYDRAIADYSTVISLKPNNPGPLLDRSRAYRVHKKDLEKAQADLENAMKMKLSPPDQERLKEQLHLLESNRDTARKRQDQESNQRIGQ